MSAFGLPFFCFSAAGLFSSSLFLRCARNRFGTFVTLLSQPPFVNAFLFPRPPSLLSPIQQPNLWNEEDQRFLLSKECGVVVIQRIGHDTQKLVDSHPLFRENKVSASLAAILVDQATLWSLGRQLEPTDLRLPNFNGLCVCFVCCAPVGEYLRRAPTVDEYYFVHRSSRKH